LNENVLTQLVEKFDDLKERLVRIEENVKSIGKVETELDILKLKVAETEASTKSAHKRQDEMQAKLNEKDQDIKWLKRQFIGGSIGVIFAVITFVVVAAVKGWI
jgi:chromosome segregation ATPase